MKKGEIKRLLSNLEKYFIPEKNNVSLSESRTTKNKINIRETPCMIFV